MGIRTGDTIHLPQPPPDRPVVIYCRPRPGRQSAEMLRQIHGLDPQKITVVEWHRLPRAFLEAAESAADWLWGAVPGSDQHARGWRRRQALQRFAREKTKS